MSILGNLLALRAFQVGQANNRAGSGSGVYLLFYIVILIDIFVIFPEIHSRYIVTDREIIVKRLIYFDVTIPFAAITAVEHATLLTFGGFALHIMESSGGAYKIVYVKRKRRHSAAVICPKEGKKFICEIELYIDKNVILLNSTESAFKKKKDGDINNIK